MHFEFILYMLASSAAILYHDWGGGLKQHLALNSTYILPLYQLHQLITLKIKGDDPPRKKIEGETVPTVPRASPPMACIIIVLFVVGLPIFAFSTHIFLESHLRLNPAIAPLIQYSVLSDSNLKEIVAHIILRIRIEFII